MPIIADGQNPLLFDMSESSDSDSDFDADDVYSMDIFERTDDVSDILDRVKKHDTFVSCRNLAKDGYALLTAEQVDAALDVNVVDWNDYHTKLLESIVEHRGTNKTNATRRSIAHVNTCSELKTSLSRDNSPDFAEKTNQHLNEWRSLVYSLASLFIEELERSANNAVYDLSTKIDDILAADWVPSDGVHAETIYFIVGAMLHAAKKKMENPKTTDSLRQSLHTLITRQSTSKEEAIAAGAPTKRVVEREAVSLKYATNDFYKIVCKYESVYRSILNDEGIQMHGEGVLRTVSGLLSRKDVGLKELLDLWTNESEVVEVATFLLKYYTDLRGKDFVRKENAQVVRAGETHRATLGAIHDYKKREHEKSRHGDKSTSKRPAKRSKTSSNDDAEEEAEDSPSMSMTRDQLVALCKQYKLGTSGKKQNLLDRIRQHMENEEDGDEADEDEDEHTAEGAELAGDLIYGDEEESLFDEEESLFRELGIDHPDYDE